MLVKYGNSISANSYYHLSNGGDLAAEVNHNRNHIQIYSNRNRNRNRLKSLERNRDYNRNRPKNIDRNRNRNRNHLKVIGPNPAIRSNESNLIYIYCYAN